MERLIFGGTKAAANIALPLFGQGQHSSRHFISIDHLLFWGLTSTYSQTAAMQDVEPIKWDPSKA
jgi:hypothetical protein